MPLGVRVDQACGAGIGIRLLNKAGKSQWLEVVDEMFAFNEKHFTVSTSKKSYLRESKEIRLFYGHC